MSNVVILKWNPAISSFNFIRFLGHIVEQDNELNWSIWEYEKVHKGDEFYMLKVGCGINGIVMAGKLTSEPYVSDDWSGRGRKVYYSDFKAELMVNPATLPIIESNYLEDNVPGFDWFAGHSGAVLDDQQAQVFHIIYDRYLRANAPVFLDRQNLIAQRRLLNDQFFFSKKLLEVLEGFKAAQAEDAP